MPAATSASMTEHPDPATDAPPPVPDARAGDAGAPPPGAMVHVIGASGRSGVALCRALLAGGSTVVPVVRSRARWEAAGVGGAAAPLLADLGDPRALAAALDGAALVASCAHARHAGAILAAAPAPARIVLLGSTRRFTRWPDAHGRGVQAGEAALRQSGHAGVMLHPAMVYGAAGEDNVQRLAAWLRRLPRLGGRALVPLPGGGRALVQPIHQSDVTRAVLAALARDWPPAAPPVVIAGPEPLPYAALVAAVAAACGLPAPRILAVPAAPLRLVAPLTAILPGVPRVRAAELRRLLEDKAFDVGPMRDRLGVVPIGLREGLAATFAGGA